MKKILSLILILVMVLSIIPTTFAATTFTTAQLYTAAGNAKTFIETNKRIPATVTVGGVVIPGADFFLLMCKQVANLGANTTYALTTVGAKAPENPEYKDSTKAQVMKADFVNEAKQIIAWSEANGNLVPNYSTMEAGVANYNSMFYMYVKVLNFYKSNNALPNYNTMVPWAEFAGTATATVAPTAAATVKPTVAPTKTPTPTAKVTTTNSMYFTVAQIGTAATTLRNTIDSTKKVPTTLKIGSYVTATSTFLRMMAAAISNINGGDNTTSVYSKAMAAPASSNDSATTGNMLKANYVALADSVYDYMAANSKAPASLKGKTNGTLGYYNIVYSFAKIMAYYKANGALPNYCSVQAWSKFTGISSTTTTATTKPATTTAPSTSTGKYTLSQILTKAVDNKTWITTNKALPNYTTIDGTQVKMPDYLYMICQATIDLTNGVKTNKYSPVSAKAPTTAFTESFSGTHNIYTADYKDMAKRIVSYMKSNSYTVPAYCTYKTSTQVGYKSLVFMFSKILAYYKTNSALPNYCAVSKFSTSSSSSTSTSTSTSSGREACPKGYEKYLVATTNCQVNNATIKSVAKTARGSATTQYNMGFNVFNYLQRNTSYWYAYSNTKLGALGTWNKRKGNCCDLGHLAVAVWRAAGVPARYYHAQITSSGGANYGHVWAQCYINGKWYHGDLSNSINTLRTSLPQSVRRVRILNGTYITLPF